MNNWRGKLLSIVLVLFSLIFDGFIASYWSTSLDTSYGLMVPRITFLLFIILSFHYEKKFMLFSAVIFGLLMDTYYLGFTGIYLFSLILIVLIVSKVRRLISPNVLTYTMLAIIILTLIEIFIYMVIRILGMTGMTMQEFLVNKLAATLLLNTVIMVFTSYFIQKLILSVNENKS